MLKLQNWTYFPCSKSHWIQWYWLLSRYVQERTVRYVKPDISSLASGLRLTTLCQQSCFICDILYMHRSPTSTSGGEIPWNLIQTGSGGPCVTSSVKFPNVFFKGTLMQFLKIITKSTPEIRKLLQDNTWVYRTE